MMYSALKQHWVKRVWRTVTALLICCPALFIIGCSKSSIKSSPYSSQQDSAPKHIPAHLDRVPDQVPKVEPLSRYGNRFKNSNSYVALKRRYSVMPTSKGYRAQGQASWYGTKFQGRRTSSGEPYDMFSMTAAHRTLPLPTYARVTNVDNGKSVIVKVNDRGPFHNNRLIDLSYVAAHKLGILGKGTGRVTVESVDPRDHNGCVPGQKRNFFAHNHKASRDEMAKAQQSKQSTQHAHRAQHDQRAQHAANHHAHSADTYESSETSIQDKKPSKRSAIAKTGASVTTAATTTASTFTGTAITGAAGTATSAGSDATTFAGTQIYNAPERAQNTMTANAKANMVASKATALPTAGQKLYLQIGAFSQKSLAENLVNEVAKLSKYSAAITTQQKNNKSLFKVRLGPFSNQTQIQQATKALAQANLPSPVMVKEQ